MTELNEAFDKTQGMLKTLVEGIDQFILYVWKNILDFIFQTGLIFEFSSQSMRWWFRRPARVLETIRHIEFIGNQSVFIIILTGVFTGMALSYQIFQGFEMVNASNLVGPTVALGISHELGPVLTGLIIAARAGGAMAARIGTMRVTEQIDALEVMGVDPYQYLVAPRLLAAVISTPLLCAVFDFVAMLGSYFVCIKLLELDKAVFWDKITLWMLPRDIYQGLFKAGIFGFVFAVICTYRGFRTEGGARGVGEATNRGVVISMVLIIVLDYFISNLLTFYFNILDAP